MRKYCFTTISITFIESEKMARRLGLRSYICSALASAPAWLRLRYCRKTHFNCCRSTYQHVLHEDFILTRCEKL